MELNLTTFSLETVNFLVLVWILKRLFFVPVKSAIEARRLEVKKRLDDAETTRDEAKGLQKQYENRLKDWDREREVKLDELKKEIDLERERRLKEVTSEVAKEHERLRVQEEKYRNENKERQEREAIAQSLVFLSKLLAHFSSHEVETSIIRTFVETSKAENMQSSDQTVVIRSAFPLEEHLRAQLSKTFASGANQRNKMHFEQDPSLIAGLEITLGSTVLRANLRDELKFFESAVADGI